MKSFLLALIVCMIAGCGAGTSVGNGSGGGSASSPEQVASGPWEFTVTTSNALVYGVHSYMVEANVTTEGSSSVASNLVYVVQQIIQGPPFLQSNFWVADPDACGNNVGTLNITYPSPGDFAYTIDASSPQLLLTAQATGAGTLTATGVNGTYASTEQGCGNGAPSDSGSIQGIQAPLFSGNWTGSINGMSNGSGQAIPVVAHFQPDPQSLKISVSGSINNVPVNSESQQYGAFLNSAVGWLRIVAKTTDGYPTGQSGPAIYINVGSFGAPCPLGVGCSGVLLPEK